MTPTLGTDECLIRIAPIAADAPHLRELLDVDERGRLARYVNVADRRRFTVAAALLRLTVAEHLDRTPRSIRIDRTCPDCGRPHGKPRIVGAAHVEVSVSHAGDLVAVAITEAGPVGVDIEPVPATFGDLVAVVCHPDERAAITTARDFAVTWVRKEAVLKVDGVGLRRNPATVVVTPPTEPPAVVSAEGPKQPAMWLHDLHIDARHVGAVAVRAETDIDVRIDDATGPLAG